DYYWAIWHSSAYALF
nr:immunoglobulin light chain junction region [Macaca mulatta]